jgi:hypothetical protein
MVIKDTKYAERSIKKYYASNGNENFAVNRNLDLSWVGIE